MADRTPYQPVSTNVNPYSDRPPARESQYYTPEAQHLHLDDDLPAGAAAPHFMGANPDRNSFASSRPTLTGDPSEYPLNGAKGLYGFSYQDSDANASQANFAKDSYTPSPYLAEKSLYAPKRSRKRLVIIGSLIALVVIAGIALAVYFAVIKPRQDKNGTNSNTSSGDKNSAQDNNNSAGGKKNLAVITGGDGSIVTASDGSTFKYRNSFGGTWYYDPEKPLVSGARAQSWTPALNETFTFGVDVIRGVNIGGWLVTEPFIVPALYEKYHNTSDPVVDEWHLVQRMTADGSIGDLEKHYETFITEQDFADIAAAGLNFVRIPIPYWAIEVRENEPFLPKVQWTYFLKAVQWARKYGLRINLDLHSVPGSQNGWNHSGRLGQINVLLGPMGLPNAYRTLDYIRIIAEFISQSAYSDVVVMFGVMNEPFGPTIGKDAIERFYVQAYQTVRAASGTGENKGPWLVFHEAFSGLQEYAGFLPDADRVQIDIHQYLCFQAQSADDYGVRVQEGQPCQAWAVGQNKSMTAFGMTHVGEWSMAINDCGLFVNGVDLGIRYEGTYKAEHFDRTGSCDPFTNWPAYSVQQKQDMQQFALQSMSALQNWFFWTWKIGNSSVTGKVEAPAWSYQLGLQEGWMPTNPRESEGVCQGSDPFVGPFSPAQTGGVGAGNIPQSWLDQFAWPPETLSSVDLAVAPSYTQTGSIVTLPNPTFTASGSVTPSASLGSGWNNPSDTALLWVPIATCGYLDPWMGPGAQTPQCPPANARRDASPYPAPTPAP